MRVRMVVGLSGPAINLIPGDEADFPDDEALRLVRAGFAVAVAVPIERAVRAPSERRKKG